MTKSVYFISCRFLQYKNFVHYDHKNNYFFLHLMTFCNKYIYFSMILKNTLMI